MNNLFFVDGLGLLVIDVTLTKLRLRRVANILQAQLLIVVDFMRRVRTDALSFLFRFELEQCVFEGTLSERQRSVFIKEAAFLHFYYFNFINQKLRRQTPCN